MGAEMDLYKEIWVERPHVSQVTPDVEIFFDPQVFMHVLPKGGYPRFKLLKQNIVLATPQQHHVYDFMTDLARKTPAFDWVFELQEVLRQLYYDAGLTKALENSLYWERIQELYQKGLINDGS